MRGEMYIRRALPLLEAEELRMLWKDCRRAQDAAAIGGATGKQVEQYATLADDIWRELERRFPGEVNLPIDYTKTWTLEEHNRLAELYCRIRHWGVRKMKIYVASSWRNEYQQYVVDALRKVGHDVYDFKHPTQGDAGFHWSEIDPKWQEWSTSQYVAALEHDYAVFGFNRDFDAMKAADACVLVLPCGRSAHLEAGWMKGAGKKVCAFIPPGYKMEPELMYKMLDHITDDLRSVLSWLTKGGQAR